MLSNTVFKNKVEVALIGCVNNFQCKTYSQRMDKASSEKYETKVSRNHNLV